MGRVGVALVSALCCLGLGGCGSSGGSVFTSSADGSSTGHGSSSSGLSVPQEADSTGVEPPGSSGATGAVPMPDVGGCECSPECEEGFVCEDCECRPETGGACAGGWNDGAYADCIGIGNEVCVPGTGLESGCLADQPGAPTGGVCFYSGCNEACDCPAPPDPAFSEQVACADIIGDAQNDCFLDCSQGECPNGMSCFNGLVCIHTVDGGETTAYDDCLNEPLACDEESLCFTDGATYGACAVIGCDVAADCAVGQTGDADPLCLEIPEDFGGSICTLDCAGGEACPDGMTCFDITEADGEPVGSFCLWAPEDQAPEDGLGVSHF